MRGSSAASYKRIQRFVKQGDPRTALWRLFSEQAEFVIGGKTSNFSYRFAPNTTFFNTLNLAFNFLQAYMLSEARRIFQNERVFVQ